MPSSGTRKNAIIHSPAACKKRIKAASGAVVSRAFYTHFMAAAQNANGLFTRGFSFLSRPPELPAGGPLMIDILVLGIGLGAFALMAAYVAGCGRV